MKAIINGIEVFGTPEEIVEYKQLEAKAEAKVWQSLCEIQLKPHTDANEIAKGIRDLYKQQARAKGVSMS